MTSSPNGRSGSPAARIAGSVGTLPERSTSTTDRVAVAAGLIRLSFHVHYLYSLVCASHNLTPAQAQLLCVLKKQHRGMGKLTQILHLEKSSLTGLVRRAESRGLLRRVPSERDGRRITVTLTDEGQRVAAAFSEDVTRRLLTIVAQLPVEDRAEFARLAGRVVVDHRVPEVFA